MSSHSRPCIHRLTRRVIQKSTRTAVNPSSRTLYSRQYKKPGASLQIVPNLQRSLANTSHPFVFHQPRAATIHPHHTPPSIIIMVAINGRQVLRRAVDILCTHYNRWFNGQPTTLGHSSSFVHPNLDEPVHKSVPLPLKKTRSHVASGGRAAKARKQGRVKRKRYNEIARENSTVFIPGGPPQKKKETRHQDTDNDLQDDYEPIDCDPRPADETQSNHGAAKEDEALVKEELEYLLLDKFKRESQFEVKVVSERVKGKTKERKARLERETREAERLWKMSELERREEKERADKWKDRRLARLEKEKEDAKSELAREKIERKQSKLQRVFKEQQQRRNDEERWKQLREEDARLAAERERDLLRKNAMLQDDLRATDGAFQRAWNEREHMRQEKEGETARRLRAEESLHRWKDLMKEYFPGGQQGQGRAQQQERLQQQPCSLEAQFELYEKKWEILRSGVDIDGTRIHLIFFSQIPWPVVNMTPTDPSQILPEHIQEFLMHPLRERPDASGKMRNRRLKARDELMKWHSDKFDQVVLSKVREEDKQAACEVAGMIARVLTDMMS